MTVVERVARVLLRDVAYTRLRDAIVDGTLPPGAALRDADLAERLGLSRAPVRDALARLVADGLVESKPQSYTRVTPLVLHEVDDAAAVVRAMHDLAVGEAVPRVRPEHVAALRTANDRFAAAVRAGDVDAALVADDELHGVLVDLAGNRAAADTIDRYTPLIRRLERRQFSAALGPRSVRLHDELIAACASGDVPAAVAVNHRIWSLDAAREAGTHATPPVAAGGQS